VAKRVGAVVRCSEDLPGNIVKQNACAILGINDHRSQQKGPFSAGNHVALPLAAARASRFRKTPAEPAELRQIFDARRGGEPDMHLIQVFIPAAPQVPIDVEDVIATIQREMTERHGGATAYLNSPAKGLWSNGEGAEEDDVIVIEVMVDTLDKAWWHQYRRNLEQLLRQDALLVRALPVEVL
jgi:hypothetical protein